MFKKKKNTCLLGCINEPPAKRLLKIDANREVHAEDTAGAVTLTTACIVLENKILDWNSGSLESKLNS